MILTCLHKVDTLCEIVDSMDIIKTYQDSLTNNFDVNQNTKFDIVMENATYEFGRYAPNTNYEDFCKLTHLESNTRRSQLGMRPLPRGGCFLYEGLSEETSELKNNAHNI